MPTVDKVEAATDGVSDDFAHDFWAVRSPSFSIELEPRPSVVPCPQCGQPLSDDFALNARVCPTHGPQEAYQSSCGNGPKYPSFTPRKKSSTSKAFALLRAGVSMKGVARQTGFHFNTVRRWRLDMIAAGERL